MEHTSDTILPKLTSPREGLDVFKTSRYEKSKQLTSDDSNEHSIESAVDRSKRYLKTYR
jgi:hypothetical protein